MATDDLLGALWLPSDGKANPADVTQALAKGARMRGAKIFEKTKVTGIRVKDGRATGVETAEGPIEAAVVVNCAGQWAKAVGRMCGVTVPLHSAEHMYIVTGQIPGVHPDLPVMRDPDGYIYVKEEVGGLLVGGFEPVAKPWATDGIPEPFEFQLLPDDWDQFQILMENALTRLPALHEAEIKSFVNGPESFTPDNNFIIGEAPELKSFYVAAGFNSIGIASGGGAGRALAEWIVGGEPSIDLWPVDIRRFARFNGNDTWLRSRVGEVLGLHYMMPWPNRELDSARPFRRSPLYDRLAAKGAVFGSKMGWERPNYFARNEGERTIGYSFGRQNWFDTVAAEQRAARQGVAVFDMTSFAKLLVQGRDAERVLQRLAANDVAVPVGESVYTGLLNARGTYESDVTDRAARAGPVPRRHRHGAGGPRRRLDRAPHPRGRARDAYRRDLGLCGDRGDGAALARAPVAGEPRRLRQRRVSVRGDPRDRHRLCDAPRLAPHLCRRARLGALRADRICRDGVRHADRGGRRSRARRRRLLRDRGLAPREGLPRLGPRADAGLHALAGRARLRGAPRQGRFPRPRGARRREGEAADEALRLARRRATPTRRWRMAASSSCATAARSARSPRPASATTLDRVVALAYVSSPDGAIDAGWLESGRFELDIAGVRVAVRASLKAPYDPSSARTRM